MAKFIELSQGMRCSVDDEDFDRLSQFSWHVSKSRDTFYAMRTSYDESDSSSTPLMHREILGLTDPSVQVDHADGNGLNNQKLNLRTCTNAQNQRNKGVSKNNNCGYKGVGWNCRGRWRARIKQKYLGYFDTPEEAAKAYDKAAREEYGEFAFLNFPEQE